MSRYGIIYTYQAMRGAVVLLLRAQELGRCCSGRAKQEADGQTYEEGEPREHDEGGVGVSLQAFRVRV